MCLPGLDSYILRTHPGMGQQNTQIIKTLKLRLKFTTETKELESKATSQCIPRAGSTSKRSIPVNNLPLINRRIEVAESEKTSRCSVLAKVPLLWM